MDGTLCVWPLLTFSGGFRSGVRWGGCTVTRWPSLWRFIISGYNLNRQLFEPQRWPKCHVMHWGLIGFASLPHSTLMQVSHPGFWSDGSKGTSVSLFITNITLVETKMTQVCCVQLTLLVMRRHCWQKKNKILYVNVNPAKIYSLLSEEFTWFALCLYFVMFKWRLLGSISATLLSPWNLFEEVIWLRSTFVTLWQVITMYIRHTHSWIALRLQSPRGARTVKLCSQNPNDVVSLLCGSVYFNSFLPRFIHCSSVKTGSWTFVQ